MKEVWMCATDLGPASDEAVKHAARCAHALGARLILMHAHTIEHVNEDEQTGERTFRLEKDLRAALDSIADELRTKHAGIDVVTDVCAGEAVRVILDEADRQGASCIVVGTHGRQGVAHLLLGSVAERVVHGSTVPVLVVKREAA